MDLGCAHGAVATRSPLSHAHDAVDVSPDHPETTSDPEDPSSDDDDDDVPDPDDDDEDVDEDEDIARSSRWRFLARRFARWFQSAQYGDDRASTSVDLRFDAFYVFVPYEPAASGDTKFLRKLRDATELVAYMLQLDKNAWWFMRKARKPWFRAFFPSNYDPETLVPKMAFVLHQRFGPGDDRPGAVKRLQYMLVDCDDGSGNATHGSFIRAKRRILEECDPGNALRDFKIPITFQLRPEEAQAPDQLKVYLQDVIALVEAVQCKSSEPTYPFRLEEMTLGIHLEHASHAHAELTRLLALGVPVTMRLRHPHTHISLPFSWTDFGWHANVFPAFVGHDSGSIHSIVSRAIHSSVELLSAVAFSSTISALEIEQDDEREDATEVEHAKWLAYALRQNTTLRSLEMHSFQGTHELLDAMATIQSAQDPARLLDSDSAETSEPARLVRLRADAVITTPESNGPQSFAELHISSDAEFPLVSSNTGTDTISFVVPGHAICSTSLSSVVSTRSEQPSSTQKKHTLRSLSLRDAYCDRGVLPRFVDLFGQSLEELRWADSLEGGYDEDLDAVFRSCPQLTRLYLQGSSLRSLTPSWLPQLRTLSLMHAAVPMDSLVALFQALGRDDTSTLSLESLSYYCPGHSLDASAADAALAMLATNRRLQSLSVGVASAIYDQYEPQFQDARDVAVLVEQLPIEQRLAMCSVVRCHQATEPAKAVGRLDRACLTHIFQWFQRHAYRRVRIIQSI